jgi:hypothetical protein
VNPIRELISGRPPENQSLRNKQHGLCSTQYTAGRARVDLIRARVGLIRARVDVIRRAKPDKTQEGKHSREDGVLLL